jgi:hypothetical protein
MKLTLTRRRLHTVKHALRTVLVITGTYLLFSCKVGGMPAETKPAATVTATAKVSMSLSLATIQPVQCSQATLAAGWYHTVGLKTDGTVTATGNNNNGQLAVTPWAGIQAVAAGNLHTAGLKTDGTVTAVGDNTNGQLNVSSWSNIKAVAAGNMHTVGLKDDGTVVATGSNTNGQLNVSSWSNIKAVAAGNMHTVGLKDDGTVVATGSNTNGQLNVSSWTNIKAIAAGNVQTFGLKDDGTVVAVGYNGSGQLNVTAWTNITAIAAGVFHSVGLRDDGTVVAAGSNSYGQMNVSSWTNIMPVCSPMSQDVTPPDTTSMVTGTLGNNGWYVSDVQITLTATDNDGGSGVKEIHYTVDGIETVVPGSLTSLSIVSDGTHTVSWYAIDNAGNAEAPEEITINIDRLAPTITGLNTSSAILWPPNHKMVNVAISGSVVDAGSGIASAIITVTDEYGIFNRTVSGFGSVVALEAWRKGDDMDGRVYTITVVVTDDAGNQSMGTTTVVVPHDMR